MRLTVLVVALALGWQSGAYAGTLTRYPTASATEIVFVAHDDLWSVPLQGGSAHRLTQDHSAATTPLFSPADNSAMLSVHHRKTLPAPQVNASLPQSGCYPSPGEHRGAK